MEVGCLASERAVKLPRQCAVLRTWRLSSVRGVPLRRSAQHLSNAHVVSVRIPCSSATIVSPPWSLRTRRLRTARQGAKLRNHPSLKSYRCLSCRHPGPLQAGVDFIAKTMSELTTFGDEDGGAPAPAAPAEAAADPAKGGMMNELEA